MSSFKKYTVDDHEKALVEINFSGYKAFDKVNDANSKFIQKLMEVIDKGAPIKDTKVKRSSQKWFDNKILEKTKILINLIKLLRNTKKLSFMQIQIKRFINEHNIICKISLQKRKNNFLTTNSKSVSVKLKTYGKLLNHSSYLINMADV